MADGKQKPIWYVVGCVGLAILSVPCIGVLAAIAIPAFVNYTRRAKTAEARANVAAIARGVTTYCESEHMDGGGPLPPAIAPSITTPSAARVAQMFGPAWADVGFGPSEPLYYAYSIERPDASRAVVVAEGDLDGDGTRSHFQIDCTASGATCSCGELTVTNELE